RTAQSCRCSAPAPGSICRKECSSAALPAEQASAAAVQLRAFLAHADGDEMFVTNFTPLPRLVRTWTRAGGDGDRARAAAGLPDADAVDGARQHARPSPLAAA